MQNLYKNQLYLPPPIFKETIQNGHKRAENYNPELHFNLRDSSIALPFTDFLFEFSTVESVTTRTLNTS